MNFQIHTEQRKNPHFNLSETALTQFHSVNHLLMSVQFASRLGAVTPPYSVFCRCLSPIHVPQALFLVGAVRRDAILQLSLRPLPHTNVTVRIILRPAPRSDTKSFDSVFVQCLTPTCYRQNQPPSSSSLRHLILRQNLVNIARRHVILKLSFHAVHPADT